MSSDSHKKRDNPKSFDNQKSFHKQTPFQGGGGGHSSGGGFRNHNNNHNRGNQPRNNQPYNANLARFKRQNPGSGPHGFGGTYKKGEKGGFKPQRDEEFIPLAERGLHRHGQAPEQIQQKKQNINANSLANNSCTAIKSKIRDLTRLLKKPNLDPTIQKHKERELKLVEAALKAKQEENQATKVDAKYKHIKFYERRKITRKLAGLQRKLASMYSKTGGDIMSKEEKELRKDIAKWQLDLDYVDYYPHGEKYIALFRSSEKKSEAQQDGKDGSDASDDEDDDKTASKSSTESKAAADAAEAARAAIRKKVAAAKAVAVKAQREASGVSQPEKKRKREDAKEKDELFQLADDDDEEPTKPAKKDSAEKNPQQAQSDSDDADGDDFMQSDSDSDEEEEEEESEEESSEDEKPAAKKQKK